jgi:hypothetical protein
MAKATLDSITINAQLVVGGRTLQVCDFTTTNAKGQPVTKAHLRIANDANETVTSLKLNKDAIGFLSTVKNITDGNSLTDTIADNEEFNSLYSRLRDIPGKSHGDSYLAHTKQIVSFVTENYEGDGRDSAALSRKATITFASYASGKDAKMTREAVLAQFAMAYDVKAHAEMLAKTRNEDGFVVMRQVTKKDDKVTAVAPVVKFNPKVASELPKADKKK